MNAKSFLVLVCAVLLCVAGYVLASDVVAPAADAPPSVDKPSKDADPGSVTVYITKTGAKYHRETCRYLRKSSIPIALKDAVARGFTPCSVCRPPVLPMEKGTDKDKEKAKTEQGSDRLGAGRIDLSDSTPQGIERRPRHAEQVSLGRCRGCVRVDHWHGGLLRS